MGTAAPHEASSFPVSPVLYASHQSRVTDQQQLPENDLIISFLCCTSHLPKMIYSTIRKFTNICPNGSFCCNFQCWFPDSLSAVRKQAPGKKVSCRFLIGTTSRLAAILRQLSCSC